MHLLPQVVPAHVGQAWGLRRQVDDVDEVTCRRPPAGLGGRAVRKGYLIAQLGQQVEPMLSRLVELTPAVSATDGRSRIGRVRSALGRGLGVDVRLDRGLEESKGAAMSAFGSR